VVAELVTSGNTLTVHVFDEGGKPVPTKGFSGSALVVAGANKETVTLAASRENALAGHHQNPDRRRLGNHGYAEDHRR